MKFGIKEAQAAAVFAKTREQKETVLAVVSMLNIPIVVDKQVNKQAKKLNTQIDIDRKLVAKLKDSVKIAEKLVCKNIEDKEVIAATLVDWAVS
jgi:hypothetical protein